MDRGGWKRGVPALQLCHSGAGVKDTQNVNVVGKMTAVGFEPTQLALVELESTPLDHLPLHIGISSETDISLYIPYISLYITYIISLYIP